jgi:hypothetical protein
VTAAPTPMCSSTRPSSTTRGSQPASGAWTGRRTPACCTGAAPTRRRRPFAGRFETGWVHSPVSDGRLRVRGPAPERLREA